MQPPKRNSINSEKLDQIKKKKKDIFKRKFIIFCLLFVVLIIALAFFSRWNEINIKNIAITGNKVVESQAIESAVMSELSGNYLFVFPKTNFLIYPNNSIKKKLTNDLKRLDNIYIDLNSKDITTLDIKVTERTPLYTWCGMDLPIQNESPKESICYFVDSTGYIFDEAPYFSGEVYFKFYGDIENKMSPLGNFFNKENFNKYTAFKNALEEAGLKPVIFRIVDDTDAEVYLSSSSKFALGPKVIFKFNTDFVKLAEDLNAALNVDPLKTNIREKYESLLYLDLRFDNKVYYKFR